MTKGIIQTEATVIGLTYRNLARNRVKPSTRLTVFSIGGKVERLTTAQLRSSIATFIHKYTI